MSTSRSPCGLFREWLATASHPWLCSPPPRILLTEDSASRPTEMCLPLSFSLPAPHSSAIAVDNGMQTGERSTYGRGQCTTVSRPIVRGRAQCTMVCNAESALTIGGQNMYVQSTYCQSQAACRCGLPAFLDCGGEWRPVPPPPDSAHVRRQRVIKESPRVTGLCVSRLRIRDLRNRHPSPVCQPAPAPHRPPPGGGAGLGLTNPPPCPALASLPPPPFSPP